MLDKLIEATYYKHGNGVQIPIMAIPKIFDDAHLAVQNNSIRDDGRLNVVAAIETSIIASIATYRVN